MNTISFENFVQAEFNTNRSLSNTVEKDLEGGRWSYNCVRLLSHFSSQTKFLIFPVFLKDFFQYVFELQCQVIFLWILDGETYSDS